MVRRHFVIIRQVFAFIFVIQACGGKFFVLASTEEYPEPVAFYPLNKQFGTRDISKNYLTSGTAVGVTLATGPYGKEEGSYYFQGSASSYIEIPKESGLDVRTSLSVLMWVYSQGTDGPLLHYDTGSNVWGVHIFMHFNSGTSRFYVSPITRNNANDGSVKPITYPVATNGWNYVGYTYDRSSGKQRIYVDGVMAIESQTIASDLNTNFKIKLGGVTYRLTNAYKGRMSCLQMYNKALTPTQVRRTQLYCKTNGAGLQLSPYQPCLDYQRANHQSSGLPSDKSTYSRIHWYRLRGNVDTPIFASSCPKAGSCGTQSPGWLNGQHPSRETGIIKLEICYRANGSCCGSKGTVFVRQCYGYYVYKFDELPNEGRFCMERVPNIAPNAIFMSSEGECLSDHVFHTENDVTEVSRCMAFCLIAGDRCKSFNYIHQGNGQCQLNNATMTPGQAAAGAVQSVCTYYEPVN